MSDKTFFDWFPFAFDPECDGMALTAWQAATELATAIERERCAVVCENRVMGDLSEEDDEARDCAEVIRQGGDT